MEIRLLYQKTITQDKYNFFIRVNDVFPMNDSLFLSLLKQFLYTYVYVQKPS